VRLGFVAILGIIALSGMIIRNSVILIDQIDMDMAKGLHPWDAVIDATTHRLRPIVLTAAASLGMIPIASEVFWGPMAYAIIGGLFVATLLTLLFLPALYVAWFRVKEPAKERQVGVTEPVHQDGFEYEGQGYRSLTVIAERITGAHWSGPRFFGVTRRARASLPAEAGR
jgi:hypothetical protein